MDILVDQHISECKESFSVFDPNGTGTITTLNLKAAMQQLGQNPTDIELRDMVNEIDADGNGTIDFPEFLTMMSRKNNVIETQDDLFGVFKVFDPTDTGFIDENGIKMVLLSLGESATDEEVSKMIFDADIDKDGKINFQEFLQLVRSDVR